MARISSTCLVLFGMWVALASSAWAQATPGYTIHQITYPNSLHTYAHAVNDHKDIVGSYVPGPTGSLGRLFTKYGSVYADLTIPVVEVLCHDPFGINNHKHIAGFFCDETTESGDIVPSFERVSGSWRQVSAPDSITTVVTGINDGGSLVGYYFEPRTTQSSPFLLTPAGFVDLPPSPVLDGEVRPSDINNRRQIVGTIFVPGEEVEFTGFLLVDGEYTLFTVPGAQSFWVTGINDHGHIVGRYFAGEHKEPGNMQIWRGFLLKNGVFTIINATKDASTFVSGINNHGDIVGTFHRPYDSWLPHGFLAVPKATKVSQR